MQAIDHTDQVTVCVTIRCPRVSSIQREGYHTGAAIAATNGNFEVMRSSEPFCTLYTYLLIMNARH